jgi:hypothetical protein
MRDYVLKFIAIPLNGKVSRNQTVPIKASNPEAAVMECTSYYKHGSMQYITVFDDGILVASYSKSF